MIYVLGFIGVVSLCLGGIGFALRYMEDRDFYIDDLDIDSMDNDV